MLDLHCHLLPGIDDGPPDTDGMLALARAQVAAGVRTVACTPHVDWDMPNTAAGIAEAVAAARAALAAAEVPLDVVAGAEVGLTRAAETDDAELAALRLAGGPWLLLEAPLSTAVGVERIVQSIAMRGHRILLAHPERSPAFQRDPEALGRLVQGGVLTQVTASALTGAFGSTVQRFAERLMREGLVHVIASDAHDATRRPPGLRQALERTGRGSRGAWLTELVPAAIVAGEPIPPGPLLDEPRARRWWRRG